MDGCECHGLLVFKLTMLTLHQLPCYESLDRWLPSRQFAHAILAGDEFEAIPGDPEIDLVPEPGHARDVEKRREEPETRQPPGHPTEGREACIDRAA